MIRNLHRFALLTTLILSGWLGWLPLAWPGDATPSEASPLRVGVTPTLPPMVFKQGGTLVGIDVDLARLLGQELGRPVKFVEVPWEDQLEALTQGRTDIIMSSMSITMARRFLIDFSEPYLTVGQMALVRRTDKSKYDFGFPAKPPGTVGVLKATTGDFLVQGEFPKAKRKPFGSGEEAARALIKRKIDLFISDSTLVWYLGGAHANEGLSVVPLPLSQEQLGCGVRKSDPEFLASVNRFLAKSRQNGTLNRVIQRWIPLSN